jgi:hypothetical protein
VSCNRHQALDDLVAAFTNALNTTGQVTHSYLNNLERDLVRQAATQATRSLGRPTRTFEKPGMIHLLVTNWGNDLPGKPLENARIRRIL